MGREEVIEMISTQPMMLAADSLKPVAVSADERAVRRSLGGHSASCEEERLNSICRTTALGICRV